MLRSSRPALLAGLAAALAAVTVPVLTATAQAAPAAPTARTSSPWTPSGTRPGPTKAGRALQVDPEKYRAFTLDAARLTTTLDAAPAARSAAPSDAATVRVQVPAPDGTLESFDVAEDSVMAPGLAAEYPQFTSYAGQSVDDPATSIRLDYSPLGFHAAVRGPAGAGAWYVDPAYAGQGLYLSYFGADLAGQPPFTEAGDGPDGVKPGGEPARVPDTARRAAAAAGAPGQSVVKRTYRLALLNDPTYAKYVNTTVCPGLGSDACVAMAKATLINRVDQVYNDDLAIDLKLVEGLDKLNLDTDAKATGANGPCGSAVCFSKSQLSSCGDQTLLRTRLVLGQLLGADKYDIGHLALGTNGGGLASVGVVGTYSKGQGCTGVTTPVGDLYAVDYVAHEMGHQFGGEHTFNGVSGNCAAGNRTAETSVEPGSGSSIMAYAGICPTRDDTTSTDDNLQAHSDPYFSQRSQSQVGAYTTTELGSEYEVQTVALRDFGTGDSFRLTYQGRQSAVVTYAGYTAAKLEAAVSGLVGSSVSVYPFGGYGTAPNATGFEIDFDGGALQATDVEQLGITATGATGFVSTTDQGGERANQGAQSGNGNHNPTVTPAPARTIPLRTPFTLTGSATDPDSNPLQYLWEQDDAGGSTGTALRSQAKKNGPLFRIFGTASTESDADAGQSPAPGENEATAVPSRTFPDLTQVLAGNTNAATGTCTSTDADTARDCFSEWLPTSAYTPSGLDFRLTARDNVATGGGTSYADTRLTLDKTAGPLLVTSQPAGGNETRGAAGTVTWDVAGTNKASLAPNVSVSLSTDGGATWSTLVASTPNDGSADVTWPSVSTDDARIRVAAVGNVFFAVNSGAFTLGTAPSTTLTGGPAEGSVAPSRTATFTPSSNVAGATYECRLDGATAYTACPSPLTYTGLSSATHTLSVRAVSDGTPDPSPVTRTWTVPFGSASITSFTGSWARVSDSRPYDGQYLRSSTKGSSASFQVTGARSLSLIVTKFSGAGSVDVYVDGVLKGTVSLASSTAQYRVPVLVKTFTNVKTATVKVVNRAATQVRIEGYAAPTR